MKRIILALLATWIFWGVSAQDNMEPFRHVSVGAEIGLHGLGVEVAVPIHERIVFKAGYNWASRSDLLKTDIIIDTKELHEQQEQMALIRPFENEIGEEAVISSGMRFGMNNVKAMLNWYPFSLGRFYLSGGVYYSFNDRDPFIMLSGYTTEEDWAAYKEICNRGHFFGPDGHRNKYMALTIDGHDYILEDKGSRGYFEADFVTSQLKYYVGMGLGRCIPNNRVGLQLEVGAMIYNSATLYCQDEEVASIREASVAFGDDVREVLEYIDKYPVYPQLTMRLSFRAL